MFCHSCKTKIALTNKIGFRDDCPQCRNDLHVCLNCHFYDTSSYNECRETAADRVVDKEKANYCEYFQINSTATKDAPAADPATEARKKLEQLFGKKNN